MNGFASQEFPVKVLLVDDQKIIGESIRLMLEGIEGLYFDFCSNPDEAVERAIEFCPTVILQDLVMPRVDGLNLVRDFRRNDATKDIPLVVLSAKEEASIKAEAFAAGANDYMVKFPEKEELLARIFYHSKGYISQLERNAAFKKLESELADAAAYVKSQLPPPLEGDIQTSWRYLPSAQLGGDVFGYHWIDEDHFAIYLLDVCGHGVRASLLAISIRNVIHNQSLPKTDFHDPSQVLSALNAAFPMEKHHDMFFTIWYGVYDKKKRTLTFSSGGHPPAILFTDDDVKELKTQGVVIGAVSDAKYDVDTVNIEKSNQLFVFSDGIYEVCKGNGTIGDYEEFKKKLYHLKGQTEGVIDALIGQRADLAIGAPFPDDITILRIKFS